MKELRSDIVPATFAGTGAEVLVGGTTSENIDYFSSVIDPAPYVIGLVLLLTFVLLTVAFRSVVVGATAVVLNLLSVGAAYGLLVTVFQYGVGADLLGFQQADTIEAWVPLFLFSVLFGLSMDYQVLLLSRIKERYDESGDTTDAVTFGVASTARIITGAALIIVAVFSGFARGDLIMFQQMGSGWPSRSSSMHNHPLLSCFRARCACSETGIGTYPAGSPGSRGSRSRVVRGTSVRDPAPPSSRAEGRRVARRSA